MNNKKIVLAGLLAAFAGAGQAQTACSCDASAARSASAAALASLLGNRMACGVVGNEVWQEWHNGTTSGSVHDYKQGPAHPVDPSAPVGTYAVNANNTVTYAYGAGGNYTYDVCFVATSNTYTFCGANYGGRNITGVKIGGAGLAACSSVVNVRPPSAGGSRT